MTFPLGKSIRALRSQKGVTQEALAEHLSVSFQAVSKWELGATAPDISLLPDIAVYFGVTIDALFALPEDARLDRIENMLRQTPSLPLEQFQATEDYLTELLAHTPDHERACLLLALLYLHQADSLKRKAQAYARHAQELRPGKPTQSTYITAMGGVSGDLYANRHYELIAHLQEYADAHPDDFLAHCYWMNHLLADHRLYDAEALLRRMEQHFPGQARLPFYAGDLAYRRGHHPKALALWAAGVKDHCASDPSVHFYYAERMEWLERYDEALAAYEKDYEASPKPRCIDAPLAMARIHELQGAWDQAIAMRERQRQTLQTEWGLVSGEAIEACQREIQRLRQKSQT